MNSLLSPRASTSAPRGAKLSASLPSRRYRPFARALLLAISASTAVAAFQAQAASPVATSWDVASEFTTTAPSPVWSYGSKLGSTFTAFSGPATTANCLTGWISGLPSIAQNVGPTTCNQPSPPYTPVIVAPHSLVLHPGKSGEAATIRFKAAYAALYRISGQFYGIDANSSGSFLGTHTAVSIVANYSPGSSIAVWSGAIALTPPSTAPSVASFTSVTVMLAAGQTLDFSVKAGPGNNYFFGSTGLNAVIERAGNWCGPTNPSDPTSTTC